MTARPITAALLADLYTAFSAKYRNAFNGAPSMWSKVATEVPSSGSKNTYSWLGAWPAIRKWLGDRVINELGAHKYTLENEPYETTVEVDRDHIEDDELGIYGPMFEELGRATGMFPDEMVFGLLALAFAEKCYDGQYFIDTDHPVGEGVVSNHGGGGGTPWFLLDTSRALKPLILQPRRKFALTALDKPTDQNVFMRKKFIYGADGRYAAGFGFWQMAYGSKQALDGEHYGAARAAMQGFKSDAGRVLGIKPNLLVVPPSLEGAGLELLTAEKIDGTTNKWRGTAELLVCPWLA